jgi:nitrate/nitrite transporter NarK
MSNTIVGQQGGAAGGRDDQGRRAQNDDQDCRRCHPGIWRGWGDDRSGIGAHVGDSAHNEDRRRAGRSAHNHAVARLEIKEDRIQNELSAEKARLGSPAEQGFARVLLDRTVWLLGLCNLCLLGASYTFGLPAPTVLKGATHWSAGRVGLLMPGAALLGVLSMVLNGARSDRRQERYLHTVVPLSLVACAFLAMALSRAAGVTVFAYVLYYACYAAAQAALWMIPSDALHGRAAAGGLATVGSIGMLGAFVGPFVWGLAKDHTGGYRLGLVSLSICIMAGAMLLLLIRRSTEAAAGHRGEVVA